MSRKGSMPRYYEKNIAQYAQRRYLKNRESETKRLERKWKYTAEIVGASVHLALKRDFGLEESVLQAVMAQAGSIASAFNSRKVATSWTKAKNWIDGEVKAYIKDGFMLPIIHSPKTRKEIDEFSTQRSIADNIIKFCVKALIDKDVFCPDQVGDFLKAVEKAYLQLAGEIEGENGE